MGITRRILAISVAALSAGGAFAAVSPAGDAASGPARGAGSAYTARAEVTDIREVLNQRGEQVRFYKGEDKAAFTVAANGRWAGSMWVPWVGNDGEMGKSITISWGGKVRYWVFQDYWNTTNQVRYSTTNSYKNSTPVAGSGSGGGRKTVVVRGDGTLYVQNSG